MEEDGLSVLATRHRTPLGELDIVAADAENLIIVEVKQRARLSDAAYALTSRQSQRLLAATEYLLATNPAYQRSNVRIDVIVFDENFQARRIKDAVRAA
ncbi:hypothetical protein A0U93_04550 [Neoasaia chiangmaiensis]|uniref:Uncharacterized protein n=1 Tax=Neoasaia chiangmaiensis TaxID=320497 RepID=A0A1U9KTX5_9PROT|nr:hypothetical protein A0U93_04550 [Neoasaia chiangmaiensis]